MTPPLGPPRGGTSALPTFPVVCPSSVVTPVGIYGHLLPMVGHHFQSQNEGTGGWPGCLHCRSHEGPPALSLGVHPPSSIPKEQPWSCPQLRAVVAHQHLWILWPFLEIVGLGLGPREALAAPTLLLFILSPKVPAFFFLSLFKHLLTPSDVLGPTAGESQPSPARESLVVWHSGSASLTLQQVVWQAGCWMELRSHPPGHHDRGLCASAGALPLSTGLPTKGVITGYCMECSLQEELVDLSQVIHIFFYLFIASLSRAVSTAAHGLSSRFTAVGAAVLNTVCRPLLWGLLLLQNMVSRIQASVAVAHRLLLLSSRWISPYQGD